MGRRKSQKTVDREARQQAARDAVVNRHRKQGQRMNAKDRRILQDAWLEEFARSGILSLADDAVHVSRSAVLLWTEHDEEFTFRLNQARAKADDMIRAEIKRRAIDGVDKPVFYQGDEVAVIKEYSDQLLQFLAKSRMPEFREKQQIEHSGSLTLVDLVQRAVTEVDVS